LFLNGNAVTALGIGQPPAVCTDGYMVLTDGGPNMPYNFCGASSGTVSTGFIVGDVNTLIAVINNTNQGINGDLSIPFTGGNSTRFGITGSVTFTETPEPRSAPRVGIAIGLLMANKPVRRLLAAICAGGRAGHRCRSEQS
jgi:hypothetical protein